MMCPQQQQQQNEQQVQPLVSSITCSESGSNIPITEKSSGGSTTTPTRTESVGSLLRKDSGRISPMMREQDADLLECMHYASSQVSQYSPDGTPLLRPQDRSLPMEDVPLLLMPVASTREFLMKKEDKNNDMSVNSDTDGQPHSDDVPNNQPLPTARTTNFALDRDRIDSTASSSILHDDSLISPSPLLRTHSKSPSSSSHHKSVHFPPVETSTVSIPELNVDEDDGLNNEINNNQSSSQSQLNMASTSPRKREKFRRLLSGEIRPIPPSEDDEVDDDNHDVTEDHKKSGGQQEDGTCPRQEGEKEQHYEEEGETTVSPISVAQEAAKAKTEQNEGLAERRRMNEAIQFAQAVGESISINRDDLCIIDDSEKDDDDDHDDDESLEPKEIMVTTCHHDHHPAELMGVPSMHHHQREEKKPQEQSSHQHLSDVKTFHEAGEPTLEDIVCENRQRIDSDLPNHVDVCSSGTHHHHRRKSRPMWPFEQPTDIEFGLTEHLSGGVGEGTNFVYKGICANPPEVTKRGIQRGNYAQLHRKAWLEVSDKYHRYGKNLRLYYRYWERLEFPTNQFFDWLDSKGDAAGQPLPNLEECPRSVLDSDTVLYITNPKVTDGYALDIVVGDDGRGRVIDVDGDSVLTGPDGWIFVLRDNVMYGAPKITSISGHSKQRFHHSSFFGGKAVASAGILITDDDGFLVHLYPHSGHYRPGEAHMQRMLLFIHRKGVDLRTFDIDMQQLIHVSREKDDAKKKKMKGTDGGDSSEEKKVKKVDSLHLEQAIVVACYLSHKADFIGKGIFDKIHRIRKADATSVTEALDLVDDGGFWKKKRAFLQEIPEVERE